MSIRERIFIEAIKVSNYTIFLLFLKKKGLLNLILFFNFIIPQAGGSQFSVVSSRFSVFGFRFSVFGFEVMVVYNRWTKCPLFKNNGTKLGRGRISNARYRAARFSKARQGEFRLSVVGCRLSVFGFRFSVFGFEVMVVYNRIFEYLIFFGKNTGMTRFKRNIFLGTIFLSLNLATAQKVPEKNLDSLQEVLETMDNSNTDLLVSRGEYILSNSQSDLQKYEVLGVIINAYATKNEKEKSIRYLFRAKAIAEKIDDPEMMIKVYSTIASLYASLNLNAKAEEYLKLCHKQISRLPPGNEGHNLKAFVFSETGTIHYNNQDYTLANKYYKKSLSEYEKILLTDTVMTTSFYYQNAVYNLGKSFLHIQKHDSALFYLNRALTIKNISRPYLKYYIKTSLAEVYSSLGNNNRSLDTLHTILNDPLFENNELRAEIYLDLAHNYKTLGDESNYGLYNEKYLSISPNLKGEDISAISSVFNAEEDKLKASISTSRENTQLLFWFILGIIILSGGSIHYIFQKRKKEQLIYKSLIENLESKLANDKQSIIEGDFSQNQQVNIATSVEEDILRKLNRFEKSQQFTNTKLTMGSLAVKLKTNTTYLSDIINREKGKNYNAYINELRINYICEKIHSNPEYLNYKISYLAEASGFSSHSSFATVFKNITGISPSVFLKKERNKVGIKKLSKST